MNKGIASQLMSCTDDKVASGYEVIVADKISGASDLGKILVGLACDADDVRPSLLDLTECLRSSGNSLVYDDSLHLRIIRKVNDGLDGGLKLLGEVVGIDGKLDSVLSVHCLESLSSSSVVL